MHSEYINKYIPGQGLEEAWVHPWGRVEAKHQDAKAQPSRGGANVSSTLRSPKFEAMQEPLWHKELGQKRCPGDFVTSWEAA